MRAVDIFEPFSISLEAFTSPSSNTRFSTTFCTKCIVSNIGTDDLEVYSIESDNENFTVESYIPVILTSMANYDFDLPESVLFRENKRNSEKLASNTDKASVYKDRFNNSKLNRDIFIGNENTLSTRSTTTSDSDTNPNTRDVDPFTVAPGENYVLLVTTIHQIVHYFQF